MMNITLEQIQEAIEHGYPVTVVINGQYYEFTGEEKEG